MGGESFIVAPWHIRTTGCPSTGCEGVQGLITFAAGILGKQAPELSQGAVDLGGIAFASQLEHCVRHRNKGREAWG